MKKLFISLFVIILGALGGAGAYIFFTFFPPPAIQKFQSFIQRKSPVEAPPSQNIDIQPVQNVSNSFDISASRKNAIVLAAEKVGPSVVSITVIQTRIIRESPFFSPFGDDFFSDPFWRDFFPPRTYKEQLRSLGSGFITSPEGYILTNEHVVRGAETIKITLSDGRQFEGKLIGADPQSDLAVLKISGKNLPSAPLGNSDNLLIGEWAIAIGNPFAYLLEDTRPTVTAGVISATHRVIKSRSGESQIYRDMIQTDAAINPGNSGGPLVNADGEVIGINTFIFTASGGSEGIGFAIPINRAKKILLDLIQLGEVKRVSLGIHVQELTMELAQSLNLNEADGVIVTDVERGSPAEEVGIIAGDVIKKINGVSIKKISDWNEKTMDLKKGEKINLYIIRDGKSREITLKIDESKETGTETSLGMSIVRRGKSVVVESVKKGSIAERLGIKKGDEIQKVNEMEIKSPEDFEKALERGKNVSIVLKRGNISLFLSFMR